MAITPFGYNSSARQGALNPEEHPSNSAGKTPEYSTYLL
jgi:hypothetical protein